MTKETSIYLDLIRFSAAFAVLLDHSSGMGITGGFLWPLARYGQTAVMIFFVLSGYVISYVSTTKEKNIIDYSYARISRLYSVIIPALIVTIISNELGNIYIQDQYTGPWDSNRAYEYYRYLITLLMMQDVWGIGLTPTNNGSFWSLSFEFVYYIFFAILFYIKHLNIRVFFLVLAGLIAGPTIILLFPIWLLGYYAHRFHSQSKHKLGRGGAYAIFLVATIVLIFSPIYRDYFEVSFSYINRESIIGDYVDAFSFFCHLLAAPFIAKKMGGILFKFKQIIVFCAGLTFSLYLFHLPLVRFFAGISPFIETPSSVLNRLFVLGCTLAVVLLIGLPCERFKRHLNKKLRQLTLKSF